MTMLNKAENSMERHIDSFAEGTEAERLFVQMRADTFVRMATKHEDITEHWDVLDRSEEHTSELQSP